MRTVYHKAETRGHADHGWLNSYHTFSFAGYHDPERMHFGALRVLNDDVVAPAMGFGTHPHQNMEIISIPLAGDLRHRDSMGNTAVIQEGDVQVMSAGTGIRHSEYNANSDREVKFLQIWLFPKKQDVEPRYDQITLEKSQAKNKLLQILSPNPGDAGVWIHQDAWFNLLDLDKGLSLDYKLNNHLSGVYVFVIKGEIIINDQILKERDGFGIWEMDQFMIRASSSAEVLIMEVPMSW